MTEQRGEHSGKKGGCQNSNNEEQGERGVWVEELKDGDITEAAPPN
ncbi:MAG: hypothetical protein IPL25_20425 [Saprospiraceae bacterium]|nr:hypothetical protein [Candidatus Vicinibacter affinis]